MDLRTSHDQGMVYSPPSAILVGSETYRLSFPLGIAFVFWNRLRLEGELPLELLFVPIETRGYMYTEERVAMAGGLQSAYFGLKCQILDGLWNHPYLIANLHFISPFIKKLYEGWLSADEGFSKREVPFGEEIWHGITGIQSELPISSSARIIAYASYLHPFVTGRAGSPGYGLGVKGKIAEGRKRIHLGAVMEQLRKKYSRHNRFRVFLEEVNANSVRTWTLGFGQIDYERACEETKYVIASVNLGKHIWLKRGWF